MSVCIVTATIGHARTEECIASWGEGWPVLRVRGEGGMLEAYQDALGETNADILAYLHDDLLIRDPDWCARVLAEFADPTVGVVGFGGALRHGTPDLYRRPYRLAQLGRIGYLSNTDDAEMHGARFTGACDVAVLDGFALIVRRRLLTEAGGWPVGTPIGYVNYDYWLCATAHRHGYRVRLAGVRCQHLGGMTAVAQNRPVMEHALAHAWVYDEFNDVLPWACPPLEVSA